MHTCVYIHICRQDTHGFYYHFNNLRFRKSTNAMIVQLHGLNAVCFKYTSEI